MVSVSPFPFFCRPHTHFPPPSCSLKKFMPRIPFFLSFPSSFFPRLRYITYTHIHTHISHLTFSSHALWYHISFTPVCNMHLSSHFFFSFLLFLSTYRQTYIQTDRHIYRHIYTDIHTYACMHDFTIILVSYFTLLFSSPRSAITSRLVKTQENVPPQKVRKVQKKKRRF